MYIHKKQMFHPPQWWVSTCKEYLGIISWNLLRELEILCYPHFYSDYNLEK